MASKMPFSKGAAKVQKPGQASTKAFAKKPVTTTATTPAQQQYRAGIPSHGPVIKYSGNRNPGKVQKATQGSSCANMGDDMNTTGHNVPRGRAKPAKRNVAASVTVYRPN